jgi:hypothetical protein
MALALEADCVNGGFRPNASNDILELSAREVVKKHVIGDDGLDLMPDCHVRNLVQANLVVWATPQA